MAYTIAALVKAVTATTGTNNYVLSDPASPGPLRTDVQAVDDGSLTNGQTIHYMVRDTTVTGDASFEEGIGVYTSATRTVARTAGNVIDGSSGPGVLVSWGASGQRDFYILRALDGEDVRSAANFATNLGLPRLSAANIFTAVQTLTTAGETQLRLENSVAARSWGLRHATDGIFRIRDFTAGVEPLTFGTGGTTAVIGATTTLSKSGVGNYDVFPAGTKLTFHTAPPAGWVREDVAGERVVKLATSADTVGATGGSWTISGLTLSGNTGSTTLTTAQIPAHVHPSHNLAGATSGAGLDVATITGYGAGATSADTGSAGGGTGHTHTLSSGGVSADGAWRPAFRIACIGVKS